MPRNEIIVAHPRTGGTFAIRSRKPLRLAAHDLLAACPKK